MFVLLNDDVEPPTDVEMRCKLDDGGSVEVNVARRIAGAIALGRGLDVDFLDGLERIAIGVGVCD